MTHLTTAVTSIPVGIAQPERNRAEGGNTLFCTRCFEAKFPDYRHIDHFWSGRVILLEGGSCAGKSTIINGLRILDPAMTEEGSDLTGANAIYEFMECNHEQFGVTKEDWLHLHQVLVPRKDHWHIHEAVAQEIGAKPDEYGFKLEATEEDQKRAIRTAAALHRPVAEFVEHTLNSADDLILNKVLEHIQKGENVAFDMCDFGKIAKHPISQHAQIKSVFVYCPFGKLIERVAERNRKAFAGEIDPSETRPGVFPLIQYANLVRVRESHDSDADVVDKVTLKGVEHDFETAFDAGIAVLKKTALGRIELDRMKQAEGGLEAKKSREKEALLAAFGFMKGDSPDKTIELVPRRKYDLCIDTSDPALGVTPAERGNRAAMKILK